MNLIDDEFIASYANKPVPWGFNGMGEIVFLRTYGRLKENGDIETWAETIQRVVNGAVAIGVPYTREEAEELFDRMYNLRC